MPSACGTAKQRLRILRNCRHKGRAVYYATSGIALMRNLAMTF
ncbi:hypothetical protein [Kibdelosporangium aridum]|nr:hypothetical protein [Kibdelosporangium aridum]